MAACRRFYRFYSSGLSVRLMAHNYSSGSSLIKCKGNSIYVDLLFFRNLYGFTVKNSVESTSLLVDLKSTRRSSVCHKSNYLREIRKLCENKNLCSARELLDSFLEKYWLNENLTRTFNCLLYHAVQEQDSDTVHYVIEKMKKYQVQRDGATFYVLKLYYSEYGLLDKALELLKEMQADGLRKASRNYLPIVNSAARSGELEIAFELYEEMKKEGLSSLCCCPALVRGVMNSNNSGLWENKVLDILQDIRAEREQLNIETLKAIEDWFRGQTSNHWQTSWTTISVRGKCMSCGHKLETGALTEKQHATLEQHLILHLWKSIKGRNIKSFTTIGNFIDTQCDNEKVCLPHSLDEYISKTGPYDIVLDALNIGYYCGKGNFDTIKLREMVKTLIDDGKKVLVVGAPPLTFTNLMHALDTTNIDSNNRCGIFLIKGRCILDDIYILLAAVHCGIDTLLVSNDLFQDHSHKLPLDIQILLKRWLHTNQVFLRRSSQDNKVLFKMHPSYDPIVQTSGNTWHLPSDTNDLWLCAQTNKTLSFDSNSCKI